MEHLLAVGVERQESGKGYRQWDATVSRGDRTSGAEDAADTRPLMGGWSRGEQDSAAPCPLPRDEAGLGGMYDRLQGMGMEI